MAPIIRKIDIQEGDRIRRVTEYLVGDGPDPQPGAMSTYELISRPVPLPTEDGWYQSRFFPIANGYNPYRLSNEEWFSGSVLVTQKEMRDRAPLTPVRSVPETAAEILAEVRKLFGPNATLHTDIDQIATKFGVTL